jgi:hypothetical protein
VEKAITDIYIKKKKKNKNKNKKTMAAKKQQK